MSNEEENKASNITELNNSLSTNYTTITSLNSIKSEKYLLSDLKKDMKFDNNIEKTSKENEYLEEIYYNLLLEEKNLKIRPKFGYLKYQKEIKGEMRAILVDWLDQVHYKCHFKIETLYQTIWIIDTVLSYKKISRSSLQLLGIASLYISCKFNEIYYPKIYEFVAFTDNAYKEYELLGMEKEILKIVNFNICIPTSIQFYQIIAKIFEFNEEQYNLGKYFMESALIDYDLVYFSPSIIALSCVYIVMKYFSLKNYKSIYKIHYFFEAENMEKTIKNSARKLCFLVKNLSESNLTAIKEKYSSIEFNSVSKLCE